MSNPYKNQMLAQALMGRQQFPQPPSQQRNFKRDYLRSQVLAPMQQSNTPGAGFINGASRLIMAAMLRGENNDLKKRDAAYQDTLEQAARAARGWTNPDTGKLEMQGNPQAAYDVLRGNTDTAQTANKMELVQALMGNQTPEWESVADASSLGFSPGTVAQRNTQTGQINVLSKPGGPEAPIKAADGYLYNRDGTRAFPAVQRAENPGADKTFDQADKLRKAFTAGAGDFVKARDAYGRVLASAKDASPAGDLALIFNFMKVLDPGSVVRESEFATAANSGAFGERIKAAVGRVTGGERLSPDMRRDFVTRASELYETQGRQHDNLRSEYGRLASAFDLSPENVIVDYRGQFPSLDEILPATMPEATPPGIGLSGAGGGAPVPGAGVVARRRWNPQTGALEPVGNPLAGVGNSEKDISLDRRLGR